ncbi:uncharacterized protein B0T15DRAFT_437868 [Chaetomium strumarium]|uniref:NAD(P)-binding domain-containing protein n=1 Tax=Chaetomium strumarium TaxID=1170767 RepID=A0AAJ0GN98_9PEZI|nr:hypothetical protein B0T15DRAFT_437868 [Chaetomium strumarium]
MAPSKLFEKIAIVGATGHIGQIFVSELLKTGKHTITALTRAESKGTPPESVKRVQVNYNDQETLVAALRGQDFLIITLAVRAPPDTHRKLVRAAAATGVPYVMPSFYGSDIRNPKLASEAFGAVIKAQLDEMESLGLSYVSLACGTWYEWSLALGDAWFGFQIKDRKVTFFDDGKTIVNVSTWEMCGRAVAALLSLPESGASPSLSDWKNEPVYIRSFQVSQRDILDSLHRVLNTTDEDWVISYEPAGKRAQDGLEEFSKGIITGMAKNMYAKLFIRSKAGELDYAEGLANEVLGLPEESLDGATKRAVEMVESGWNPLTG